MLKHILTSTQFKRHDINTLVRNAQKLINMSHSASPEYQTLMSGKILANMFFEPSTRTASSFQSAMMRLGGNVIQFDPRTSSTQKKETLLDTIRVMEQYTNVTVIRHPEENILEDLLPHVTNPIINAGDGGNEHPTQALLDVLTMHQELNKEVDTDGLDHLNITMVGDLKYGRTVHSLSNLLFNYKNITFNLISPPSLQMPAHIMDSMEKSSSTYCVDNSYHPYLPHTHVLYMTRIQKERFDTPEEYHAVKHSYQLTLQDLTQAHPNLIIMHPLPRVTEISPEVDTHPAAKYFAQAKYGMFMRMSLLHHVSEPLPYSCLG